MSEPYVKCPCGFEARTADASALLKAHTCPRSMWPPAVALTVFTVVTAALVWSVIELVS